MTTTQVRRKAWGMMRMSGYPWKFNGYVRHAFLNKYLWQLSWYFMISLCTFTERIFCFLLWSLTILNIHLHCTCSSYGVYVSMLFTIFKLNAQRQHRLPRMKCFKRAKLESARYHQIPSFSKSPLKWTDLFVVYHYIMYPNVNIYVECTIM